MPLTRTAKFQLAILTAAAAALTAWQQTEDTSFVAWTAITGVIAAVAVYLTSNTPDAPASKAVAASLGALSIAVTGLFEGLPLDEVATIFGIAVIGHVVTYLTPNATLLAEQNRNAVARVGR